MPSAVWAEMARMGGIAKKVNLRNTPELIFEFDESLEYGTRIDEILKGITKDLKKGE